MVTALAVRKLTDAYRSTGHLTHLMADLKLLTKAASEKGVGKDVLAFLQEYTLRVAALVEEDEREIIEDKLGAVQSIIPTDHLDKIERQFQARLERRSAFRSFVGLGLEKIMARPGQFDQMMALYAVLANNNDRVINPLVRENIFDVGRAERDEARANFDVHTDKSEERPALQGHVPGGLERMTRRQQPGQSKTNIIYNKTAAALDQLIQDTGAVDYSETVTAHPTELATAGAVKLFADLYDTKRELLAARDEATCDYYAQRLYDLALQLTDPSFHLIKADSDNVIENFTPVDEVENSEFPLLQKVKGLEETYGTFWRFMKAEWGALLNPERMMRFTLNYRLSTWVTDDIDGNKNKKSEHSLYGMMRNTQGIFAHYHQRLTEMRAAGLVPQAQDSGMAWDMRFEFALRELAALENDLFPDKKAKDLILSQERYAFALGRLYDILKNLGSDSSVHDIAGGFAADMAKAFQSNPAHPAAEKALVLSKIAGSFGFHLAKNEYRQTADEHTKIMDYLLAIDVDGKSYPGYEALTSRQRKIFLNKRLLNEPDFLKKRIDVFLASVGDGTDLRDVGDVRALTLHTVRMMQKAARFPHAHERMVLAEYANTAHYLEAVALSTACGARLHITPLLEDMGTLKQYKTFFYDIVTTPAIVKHLYDLSGNNLNKLMQNWMAAYSDNTKRFGIATRTFIEGMWRNFADFVDNTVRVRWNPIAKALTDAGIPFKSAKDFAIRLFAYHGGSHLHADRNGGRSLTAAMRDYTGYFIKHLGKIYYDHTVQGADNSRKYHVVDAVKRNLARIFSEGAIMIAQDRQGTLNGHSTFSKELTNTVAETIQLSQPRFRRDYFSETSPQGEALAHPIVGDAIQKTAGNASSRASVRKQNSGGARNIYARGTDNKTTKIIGPGDMRAITRVEDEANAGSRLSALGIYGIEDDLNKMFIEHPTYLEELEQSLQRKGQQALDDNGRLSCAAMGALREGLPAFKKLTDEIMNALRCSDLMGYDERLQFARTKDGVPITDGVAKDLENRRRDYLQGSAFIAKCLGINPDNFDTSTDTKNVRIERFRYLLARFGMPNSFIETGIAQEFDTLGTFARDADAIQLWKNGEQTGCNMGDAFPSPPEERRLRLEALARLSSTHGSMPVLQDTLYAHDLMRRKVQKAAVLAAA